MALTRFSSTVCRSAQAKRLLHGSASRRAITNFLMPAMSPTMTEGGIASWKKKEGESFLQGDVLLEIETDKATIDVEAQDDGIMGKILAPDGAKGIPVGKIIALLAEEGDDISSIEAPKDEPAPPIQAESPAPAFASSSPLTPTPSGLSASDSQLSTSHAHPPTHSRPLFPSVHRLLLENSITKPDDIKATGVRGMLTKGDVLAFLGKASGPLGTFKPGVSPIEEATPASGKKAPEPEKAPLDGMAIRQLIVSSMLQASIKARNPIPASIKNADFDSVLADYLPPSPKSLETSNPVPLVTPKKSSFLDGLY